MSQHSSWRPLIVLDETNNVRDMPAVQQLIADIARRGRIDDMPEPREASAIERGAQ